jgi:hypothetical protein
MVAEGEYERKVNVWGKPCVISVYQKSKTVWIARGDYHGEPIEVKGSSLSAATKAWAEAARYRGN